MKNEEYLGVAFEHFSLLSEGIYPRVFLGSRGDMVKLLNGFKQDLSDALI